MLARADRTRERMQNFIRFDIKLSFVWILDDWTKFIHSQGVGIMKIKLKMRRGWWEDFCSKQTLERTKTKRNSKFKCNHVTEIETEIKWTSKHVKEESAVPDGTESIVWEGWEGTGWWRRLQCTRDSSTECWRRLFVFSSLTKMSNGSSFGCAQVWNFFLCLCWCQFEMRGGKCSKHCLMEPSINAKTISNGMT